MREKTGERKKSTNKCVCSQRLMICSEDINVLIQQGKAKKRRRRKRSGE